MTSLEGARCAGLHLAPLFESTLLSDHEAASELCRACPAIEACRELLREVQTVNRTMVDAGGGPVGTWAGQLIGVSPKARRSGAQPKPREHGTDRGYYQHRTHREASCRDCKAAHKLTVWLRAAACGERVVGASDPLDNESKETTNASRPRAIGAPTPARGLADRLETTDSWTC